MEIVGKAEGGTPLPVRRQVEATFGSLTNFHRRLARLGADANSLWVANARRPAHTPRPNVKFLNIRRTYRLLSYD